MTICVLGVDAADHGLAKRWDCDNLLLKSDRSLKTESHSLDVPATLEVWPSIATGLHPTDHGVLLDPTERSTGTTLWQSMAKIASLLPTSVRTVLRSWKERLFGSSLPVTRNSHVFEQGTVTNWPGITPCHDWQRGIDYFEDVKNRHTTEETYYRHEIGNAGKGIGWLASQAQCDVPIAGVHIHILDTAGHIYANRPEKLRKVYEDVNEMVGWLQGFVDHLVIVSDHGMQTTITNDAKPGIHSFRSFIATTMSVPDALPASIYEVRKWIEKQVEFDENKSNSNESTTIDAPIEHLRDLGYFS